MHQFLLTIVQEYNKRIVYIICHVPLYVRVLTKFIKEYTYDADYIILSNKSKYSTLIYFLGHKYFRRSNLLTSHVWQRKCPTWVIFVFTSWVFVQESVIVMTTVFSVIFGELHTIFWIDSVVLLLIYNNLL